MTPMWHRISLALSFLTVLPLPGRSKPPFAEEDLARSFAHFPTVGLLLGLAAALTAALLSPFLPSAVTAVWLLIVSVVLTRGLHLDGLADLADALGGAFDHPTRLDIMKDSRIGTFGAVALMLCLAAKAAAFKSLLDASQLAPFVAIPALSRYAMAMVAFRIPYARASGGLGRPFIEHLSRKELTAAGFVAAPAAFILLGFTAFAHFAAILLIVLFFRRLAIRTLGGVTGDVLGASNEVAETALYTLAAALSPI